MAPIKHLSMKTGVHPASGRILSGYEIHIGETSGPDCDRAWLSFAGKAEGAASPSGRVRGCYMHGIFSSDQFRRAYLAQFSVESALDFEAGVDEALEALADHVEKFINVDLFLTLARDVWQ